MDLRRASSSTVEAPEAQYDEIDERLAPIARHVLWRTVARMRRFPAESTVLQGRRGYRDVLHHVVRLRLATRIPLDRERARNLLDAKVIAALYELWTFFATAQALEAVLGEPPDEARVERNVFEALLSHGTTVSWSGGIRMRTNASFRRGRERPFASTSLAMRPDLLLDTPSGLHVLDAKFRGLRAGAEGEDDDPDIARFQPADVLEMHAYRDALPDVRSAWVLFPGQELAWFGVDGAKATAIEDLPGELEGVGAVPLAPGREAAELEAVLARLVRRRATKSHAVPRPWIERDALAGEIRVALAVKWVEYREQYRELGLFLDRLHTTLTHLQAFSERSPAAGFELHRELVLGIGAITNRVHVDENELADFVELVVDSALGLVSEAASSGLDRVLLLEDLAQLWRDDRDETFWFVPERLVGLDLDPRERVQVIARVADGLEGADERTARRVGELIERLDPSGSRSPER